MKKIIFLFSLIMIIVTSCAQTEAPITISAGEEVLLDEDMDGDYTLQVDNSGLIQVRIAVRDKDTGRQNQSYDLLPDANVKFTVRENELVYLINEYEEEGEVFAVLSQLADGQSYEPVVE